MLIPSTRVEDEKMGSLSDDVIERAKETGQEALERGKQVAQDAAETAKESGREHAEGLKETARNAYPVRVAAHNRCDPATHPAARCRFIAAPRPPHAVAAGRRGPGRPQAAGALPISAAAAGAPGP